MRERNRVTAPKSHPIRDVWDTHNGQLPTCWDHEYNIPYGAYSETNRNSTQITNDHLSFNGVPCIDGPALIKSSSP